VLPSSDGPHDDAGHERRSQIVGLDEVANENKWDKVQVLARAS
jgi:hypothetical protein